MPETTDLIARIKAALEPFARWAERYPSAGRQDIIPVGELRRAASALADLATLKRQWELDSDRIAVLRSHQLDGEWNQPMPQSISQEGLSKYSQLGAYYIGRRAVWEEIHHLLAAPAAREVRR